MSFKFPNHVLDNCAIKTASIAGLVALLLGLVLAVALWLPVTFVDDTVFSGPAIKFAKTGHLTSFLLDVRQLEELQSTSKPFWYPPIFFYALGWWLTAFGCSTSSALCFFATLAAVTTFGFSLTLSRFGCAPYWCLGSALVAWTTFYAATTYGLRPEPLGLALLFVGLALIPSSRNFSQLAGFFFCALSILTAPRLAPWVAAYGGLATVAILTRQDVSRAAPWLLLSCSAIVGVGCAALVFLISIDFDWPAFSNVFFSHLALRTPTFSDGWFVVSLFITQGFGPLNWFGVLVVLLSGCLIATVFGFWKDITPLVLTSSLGAVIALRSGGCEYGLAAIFLYLTTLGLWGLVPSSRRINRWRNCAFAASVLLAGVPLLVTSAAFFKSGYFQRESWASYREIKQVVAARSWAAVWIDEFTLRYVFDFDPPLSAHGSFFNPTLLHDSYPPKDEETIYVLSQQELVRMGMFSDLIGRSDRADRFAGTVLSGWRLFVGSEPQIALITHHGIVWSRTLRHIPSGAQEAK